MFMHKQKYADANKLTQTNTHTHPQKTHKRENVHAAKCTRFQQNKQQNKTSKQQVALWNSLRHTHTHTHTHTHKVTDGPWLNSKTFNNKLNVRSPRQVHLCVCSQVLLTYQGHKSVYAINLWALDFLEGTEYKFP